MKFVEIEGEITRLEEEEASLKSEFAELQSERKAALRVDPGSYRAADVEESRASLQRVERELHNVRERAEALRAQLPTRAAIRRAGQRAERLTKAAEVARKRWDAAWKRIVRALDGEVRSAISDLERARAEYDTAIGSRTDVVDTFGVAARPLPTRLRPTDAAAARVALFGHALADVPYGGMRETVERDWKNAS